MRATYLAIFICGLTLTGVSVRLAFAEDEPTRTDIIPGTALFATGSVEAQQYEFLQQQMYRGESAEVSQQLEATVEEIEASNHRYHENLLIPLTLLGDALMIQQEYDQALTHYDRARHVARVSHGLFDQRQLAVVYREADAYRKLGDLQSAGKREEYAYEVMRKGYQQYDARQLPGLMRLGRFYLGTYNYLAARSIFTRAWNIHLYNDTSNTLAAVPFLEGLAQTHRLERFPPFYIVDANDSRLEGPRPGLTIADLEAQHIAFNNFPAGEKALQRVIDIRRKQAPEDKQATYQAMMALADWHIMFQRVRSAHTLYGYVYEQMLQDGQGAEAKESTDEYHSDSVQSLDPDAFFASPVLLYLPKPHDPRPPAPDRRAAATQGYVTLGFDVSPTGHVRKLKTIESQPEKLMDFRVRRSMRLSVFRPQLIEGVPVTAENQTYTYEYEYFPLIGTEPVPDEVLETTNTSEQDERAELQVTSTTSEESS